MELDGNDDSGRCFVSWRSREEDSSYKSDISLDLFLACII